jgi:hypothetical protein
MDAIEIQYMREDAVKFVDVLQGSHVFAPRIVCMKSMCMNSRKYYMNKAFSKVRAEKLGYLYLSRPLLQIYIPVSLMVATVISNTTLTSMCLRVKVSHAWFLEVRVFS